jgi:hypothetical protein
VEGEISSELKRSKKDCKKSSAFAVTIFETKRLIAKP